MPVDTEIATGLGWHLENLSRVRKLFDAEERIRTSTLCLTIEEVSGKVFFDRKDEVR